MRLIGNELYKVISKPMFLFLTVILLAANMVLISASAPSDAYTAEKYRAIYDELSEMPKEERTAYIKSEYERQQNLFYSGEYGSYSDLMLYRYFYDEASSIEGYSDYLDSIMARAAGAQGISIFNTLDEFSQRNAKKTAKAFEPLIGTELTFTNSQMLNTAMQFGAADIVLVVLMFVIVAFLFTDEKEKGLFILLKPNRNGTAAMMAAKICVLFIMSIAVTLVLYAGSFAASGLRYGFADLSVPVQSIYGYDGCALNVTVWQYLVIWFTSKMVIAFAISLIMMLFAVTTKSSVMVYVKVIALFAVELGLHLIISGTSHLQALKYVNLIFFLRVTPIYQYYFNLNFFRYPVYILSIFAVVTAVLIAMFAFLNIFLFVKKDAVISTAGRKQRAIRANKKVHTGLVYHELYKIFVTNKAVVILLILVLFQIYTLSQQNVYVNADEMFYRQYVTAIEGPVTEEKLDILNREQQRFDTLDEMLRRATDSFENGEISETEFRQTQMFYSQQTRAREAFQRTLNTVEYVRAMNAEGRNAQIVYESGWEQLTARGYEGYDNDMTLAVILTLAMIASFASVFSTEFATQMICIISSYKNGRSRTVRIKTLICACTMLILFTVSYAANFIGVYRQYSLSMANASLCSIQSLAGFPVDMKIWQYIALVYAVRFVTALAVMAVIFMVSVKARNTTQAISILTVCIVAPLILHLLGTDVVRFFTLNAFLSGNMYLDWISESPALALTAVLPVCMGAFAWMRVKRAFRE